MVQLGLDPREVLLSAGVTKQQLQDILAASKIDDQTAATGEQGAVVQSASANTVAVAADVCGDAAFYKSQAEAEASSQHRASRPRSYSVRSLVDNIPSSSLNLRYNRVSRRASTDGGGALGGSRGGSARPKLQHQEPSSPQIFHSTPVQQRSPKQPLGTGGVQGQAMKACTRPKNLPRCESDPRPASPSEETERDVLGVRGQVPRSNSDMGSKSPTASAPLPAPRPAVVQTMCPDSLSDQLPSSAAAMRGASSESPPLILGPAENIVVAPQSTSQGRGDPHAPMQPLDRGNAALPPQPPCAPTEGFRRSPRSPMSIRLSPRPSPPSGTVLSNVVGGRALLAMLPKDSLEAAAADAQTRGSDSVLSQAQMPSRWGRSKQDAWVTRTESSAGSFVATTERRRHSSAGDGSAQQQHHLTPRPPATAGHHQRQQQQGSVRFQNLLLRNNGDSRQPNDGVPPLPPAFKSYLADVENRRERREAREAAAAENAQALRAMKEEDERKAEAERAAARAAREKGRTSSGALHSMMRGF